jgi:molecular chaperone DnaJ
MDMSVPDYYSVLGMPPGASQDELKKRYRTLIAKYHPDRNHGPGAEERSKRINEAYGVLSDPQKRARYDRTLQCPGYTGAFKGSRNGTPGSAGGSGASSSYRSYSYGNYSSRSYTYRTYDEQRSADPMDLSGLLLRSVLKVIAILLVLWLVLNFFVLFIFLAFMVMLLYLIWVVLGQIMGFFFYRR